MWNYFIPRELESNSGSLCTWEQAQQAAKYASYAGGGVVRIYIAKTMEEPKPGPVQPWLLRFANGADMQAAAVLHWFEDSNGPTSRFPQFLENFKQILPLEGPEPIAAECTETEYYKIRETIAQHANVPEFTVQGGGWISEGASDVEANEPQENEVVPNTPPPGNVKKNYVVRLARAAGDASETHKYVLVNAAYLAHIWSLASVQGAQAFIRSRY